MDIKGMSPNFASDIKDTLKVFDDLKNKQQKCMK